MWSAKRRMRSEDRGFPSKCIMSVELTVKRARHWLMMLISQKITSSSTTFGGVIGIIVAIVVSLWLTRILLVPFVLSPGIVLITFVFSVAVGVFFSYFPARKAAHLDPIEALRHE